MNFHSKGTKFSHNGTSTALHEFHVIVARDDWDKWLVKSNKEHNLNEEKL